MIEIKKNPIKNCDIVVPGSKSYSHRVLIASALSGGHCSIKNLLVSEDTLLTMDALKSMGVEIYEKEGIYYVNGTGGNLEKSDKPIYLANSGTSMRLIAGVASIGKGEYELCGTERMHERPMEDLLKGLQGIGGDAVSVLNNGNPPIKIKGKKMPGGEITLDLSKSSQYLSSILLMAPYTESGVKIIIPEEPVSKPYIDLTVEIMKLFGVDVKRDKYNMFHVEGGNIYKSGDYAVEPDCSQASYFWGAAAITGKRIKVKHISRHSSQGDVRFAEVLNRMGCLVYHEEDGISVQGGHLKGIEVDMSNMPDVVPTLAVIASFAKGTTRITNVAHLKEKECDRLGSVAAELIKMGVDARATESGLVIKGSDVKGSAIKTYDDHRMAMAFSIAGLRVPGVKIENEMCVKKSFPNYWIKFEELYV